MSPVVAKTSDVAGTVGCDEPAVATGCTGVVRAVTELTLLLKLVHQLTVIQQLSLAWQVNLYFLSS